MDIRTLNASEIECRVNTVTSFNNVTKCTLLLYKDARVDMRLLDETFGQMNWKRTHEVVDGNLYCTISIWDSEKKEWVSKQDVGVESMTEKEKGQASDSFKRAGFNWGIGRELYTAPNISIDLEQNEVSEKNGKKTTYARFYVTEIGYNSEREINMLVIKDKKGRVRYSLGSNVKTEQVKPSNKESDEDDLIQMAYSDITNAKDVASLQEVWANYKSLQSNKNFVTAVTAKKTAILNGL
jgi:hypothetical protein